MQYIDFEQIKFWFYNLNWVNSKQWTVVNNDINLLYNQEIIFF